MMSADVRSILAVGTLAAVNEHAKNHLGRGSRLAGMDCSRLLFKNHDSNWWSNEGVEGEFWAKESGRLKEARCKS